MSRLHVMVDLETLGKGPDAAIWSIGATKFNPAGDGVVESFYQVIDPRSNEAFARHFDVDTVMWWMKSENMVPRNQLLDAEQVDLSTALYGFAEWFGKESLPVWGNGATFDNVILRDAYDDCNLKCPWSYKDDRCYRTIKNLQPTTPPLLTSGTAHNALDDAIYQSLHLQLMVKTLALTLD